MIKIKDALHHTPVKEIMYFDVESFKRRNSKSIWRFVNNVELCDFETGYLIGDSSNCNMKIGWVQNKVDENASTKRGNIAIVLWYINLEKKKTTFLDRLKFLFKG